MHKGVRTCDQLCCNYCWDLHSGMVSCVNGSDNFKEIKLAWVVSRVFWNMWKTLQIQAVGFLPFSISFCGDFSWHTDVLVLKVSPRFWKSVLMVKYWEASEDKCTSLLQWYFRTSIWHNILQLCNIKISFSTLWIQHICYYMVWSDTS